jgi:rhodanese-related sulfurtransferase
MPAKHINVDEFLAMRKKDKELIVIDVRDDDKWEEGHIPGAKHIHKSVIEEKIASKVPDKNAHIVCHCGGGQSGPRSADALSAIGYKNVSVIDGGFRSYKASGEKIVS